MTITTSDDRDEYTATASQTVFNYTFKIFASTDLNVYQTPAGQTADDSTDLITAYTVSGVGNAAGGTITLTTPASAGDLITIVSNVPSSRTTDYQISGDFIPATVNNDFDRMVSLAKQAEGLARRSLLFPESQQGVQAKVLPKPDNGKIFAWSESGEVVYRSITDLATTIDINSTVDVYPHMADFITRTPTKGMIYVESYAAWSPGVTTPKGAHFRYRTGGTNTSPTVGSPVAVSTIGTGTQAGYAWDASGAEWFIKPDENGFIDVESLGAVGGGSTDDYTAFQDALRTNLHVRAARLTSYAISNTLIMRQSNQQFIVLGQLLLTGSSGTAALQIGEPSAGFNVDYGYVFINRIDGQDNTAGRDGIRYQYAVLCTVFVQRMIRVRYGHHMRMESATARFIHNTIRGEVISTAQIGVYQQNASGGVTELDNEGNNFFINMITGSVIAGYICEPNVRANGTDFRCNFDAQNNYIVELSTFGQTNNFDCSDWADEQTATGGTSDGSTAVVTGLSDTSVFVAGCYVAASAGFPSATAPYKVVSVDSGTQVTLDTNSNGVASGTVTLTRQNFFTDRSNVRGDGLLRIGWRPSRSTYLDIHVDDAVSSFVRFYRDNVLASRIGHEASGNLTVYCGANGTSDQVIFRADEGVQIRKRLIVDGEDTLTLAAGDNTVTLDTDQNTLLLTADGGGSTVAGITADPRGREITLVKVGGGTLVIGYQDAAETTAANRITNGTGADITLGTHDTVTLRYIAALSRWLVLSSLT